MTRLVLVLALLGHALLGCGSSARTIAADEREQQRGFAAALAEVDRRLADAQALARERDRWPDHELVAQLYIERARLSGAVEDWAAASRTLETAFSLAPAGSGPILTRAELDLSLHQLERAEAALAQLDQAAILTGSDRLRATVARAELAAQRDRLDVAAQAYAEAVSLGAEPGAYAAQLALLDRKQGRFDEALAKLEQARSESRNDRGRAWAMLQAGLVEWERGRPEAALAHYDAAAQQFPGWWLIDEHRAEALTALGRAEEAEAIYLSVVERTNGPEFMDALAKLALARNDPERARAWTDAAARERARRQALLPSARLH
jgi:tetratricopeptide (TPR) repeat protein